MNGDFSPCPSWQNWLIIYIYFILFILFFLFFFCIFQILLIYLFIDCFFATVFGGPCWPELYDISLYHSSFGLGVKLIALSMFIPSQWFILVMYQSKTDFTANETIFFFLLSSSSQPVMRSWRISPAQPSDQCCASEVYRWACNAFSSSNNLRDSTLLCDAEATALGPSCHCAPQLWRHVLIFPDNSAANVRRNAAGSNRDHVNPANSSQQRITKQ